MLYVQMESTAMAIGGPDWTELFGRLDKDSSGVLSLEELRGAVRGLFRLPESVVPDGMVEAFFRAVDRDGSGGIVLEELVRFMSERKTQQLVHGCLESAAVSLGGPDWSVLMGRLRKGNPLEVSMEAMREAVRSELGVTQAVLPDKALESVMRGLEGSSEDRVSMRGVERFLREKQVLRTIDGQLEAAVLQLGGTEISELLEGVREEWSSKPMGLTDVKGMLRDAGLAADVVTDEAIELMFEYVDREGRGQIELRALEAVLTEQRTVRGMYRQLESAAMAIGGPDWTELFGRLDKDSSGVLSLEELRGAVRGLFRLPESVVPDGMVEAFFRAVDRDGSGGIVLEELVRFMSERKTQQLVHGCLESAAVSLGGPDWSVLMGRLRKGNPLEVSMEAMREAVRSELGVTQAVLPDKALESVMRGLEGSSEDRVSMRGVERFLREKQVLRTIDGQLEAAVLQLGGTEISELLEGVREEWSSKPMGLTDVKGMLRDAGLAADVVTDEAIELMFEYVDREGRGQIELRALEAVLTEQRTVRGMYRQLESAAMAIGVLFRASVPCPCHCVFTCLHAQCE